MKTKLKIIFIALILLILISGCKLIKPKQPDISEPEKIEYRKGTEALEMSFLKNFPPDEIKPNQSFQVMVEVQNQGAYDIDNLILSLTGLKEQYTRIVGESKKIIESLPGKSINFPEGSKEIVDFKAKNVKRLPLDRHTELIRIEACYRYQTIAGADICINPTSQVVVPQAQQICKADQSISLSGGQGAPIAVTRIEQSTIPIDIGEGIYELELKFHISNLGKGIAFKEEGCKEGGIIKVRDISFYTYMLGIEIECDFSKERAITLEQRDNILKCTAQINSAMGTFTTPLTIILNYWYEDKIEKIIEVIKTK